MSMQPTEPRDFGDFDRAPVLTVETVDGPYKTKRPQMRIDLPKGAPIRLRNATVHMFASALEAMTPEGEHWLVRIAGFPEDRDIVYLELVDGEHRELTAAEMCLRAVAAFMLAVKS